MNIITNNCMGGFLYRDVLEQQYRNPFIWGSFKNQGILKLVDIYDSINFGNMTLYKGDDHRRYSNIDNKIEYKWTHYRYSEKDKEIRRNGINTFYNNISYYIKTKYFERTKRMIFYKEDPIFIILWVKRQDLTKDMLSDFISKEHPHKVIIATVHKEFEGKYGNVFVFYDEEVENDWNRELFTRIGKEALGYYEKIQW